MTQQFVCVHVSQMINPIYFGDPLTFPSTMRCLGCRFYTAIVSLNVNSWRWTKQKSWSLAHTNSKSPYLGYLAGNKNHLLEILVCLILFIMILRKWFSLVFCNWEILPKSVQLCLRLSQSKSFMLLSLITWIVVTPYFPV